MTDLEKERQLYQLHKKGYEEIAKAMGDKKAFSINVNGKVKEVEVKSQKGDPGEPGKNGSTPVKGVDYFTEKELEKIADEVFIRVRKPEDGKDAIVDYPKLEEFIKSEIRKIPRPKNGENGENGKDAVVDYNSIIVAVLKKIPEVDYPSIHKYIREETQRLEDSRPIRTFNSAGPTTRLTDMSDVNASGLTSGQFLSWNGSEWVATPPAGYVMTGFNTISAPADATTYFFGSAGFTGGVTQGFYRFRIPKAGNLVKVIVENYYSGTQPTAETSTLNVRKNGTTDYAFTTNGFRNNTQGLAFTHNLSDYTLVAGDYIEFWFTTPTWVTNPGTSLTLKTTIYIE